jgi:hypothetical protein
VVAGSHQQVERQALQRPGGHHQKMAHALERHGIEREQPTVQLVRQSGVELPVRPTPLPGIELGAQARDIGGEALLLQLDPLPRDLLAPDQPKVERLLVRLPEQQRDEQRLVRPQ